MGVLSKYDLKSLAKKKFRCVELGISILMKSNIRPRRSVLYMPGANERALEKAKSLSADAIILDLEDSVAPDLKVFGLHFRPFQ